MIEVVGSLQRMHQVLETLVLIYSVMVYCLMFYTSVVCLRSKLKRWRGTRIWKWACIGDPWGLTFGMLLLGNKKSINMRFYFRIFDWLNIYFLSFFWSGVFSILLISFTTRHFMSLRFNTYTKLHLNLLCSVSIHINLCVTPNVTSTVWRF